jgi:serine/threonine protein kinase
MGMHKKTGRRVAIKIMNKKDMSQKDLNQARTEIEIMKICEHPNIIKLYDVFENPEYMYISKQ